MKRVSFSYGVMEPKTKELPITYLFKTTRGEIGIMEIPGVVEDERGDHDEGHQGHGMKSRYKLVQNSAAKLRRPRSTASSLPAR